MKSNTANIVKTSEVKLRSTIEMLNKQKPLLTIKNYRTTEPRRLKNKYKVLRVGFDLDGVLLYNPARIVRPFIYLFKRIFLKDRLKKFYYPKTNLERFFWSLFHKSSIFIAPGFEEIKKFVSQKKIKAYIITGRFSFLKKDLDHWVKKMKINHTFSGIYYNKADEQPHFFKEKLIKKLNLDVFVEDNWDIVAYLNQKLRTSEVEERSGKTSEVEKGCKIFWIYNIFDRGIKYSSKFRSLKQSIDYLVKKYL